MDALRKFAGIATILVGAWLIGCTPKVDAWFAGGTASLPAQQVAPGPTGDMRLQVRWPARHNAFIPANTVEIDVAVRQGTDSPVLAVQQLNWPTSVVLWKALPGGPLTLEATGYAMDGSITSVGTGSVRIIPSAITAAHITMGVGPYFGLDSFSPHIALPGQTLTLKGRGFLDDEVASYSVFLNSLQFPSYQVYQTNNDLNAVIPAGARNGPVAVDFANLHSTLPDTLRVIASISIDQVAMDLNVRPPSGLETPGSTAAVNVRMWDTAGEEIASDSWGPFTENSVPIKLLFEKCIGNICDGADAAKVRYGPLPGQVTIVAEWDSGHFLRDASGSLYRTDASGTQTGWGQFQVGNTFVAATAGFRVFIP